MTHTARTENTRKLKSRPVQRRNEQSGVSGPEMQAGRQTRAFTRSQGRVRSKEDGASTTGGSTAVGIKDDAGQVSIKEEEL